jgi:predicted DNA-binding transcriptional regulator AlpA
MNTRSANALLTDGETHALKAVDRFVGLDVVCTITDLARSVVFTEIAAGRFPRGHRLSAKRRGWKLSEIQAWVDTRPAA